MAQDTLQITSVRIQNFRSIVDLGFRSDRLNLFVGLNDVGKSNILRALDLFFNGAGATSPFVFERDFCKYAKIPAKKPKEVKITATLKLPPSYDATEIRWKKVWRIGGPHSDGGELCHVDGTKLKQRSRVPTLLNAIRFEYVPAVKGNDYFETLLKALHDVLVDTVADEIRSAAGKFTSTINERTRSALDDIEKRLGIKSTIELPSDLRELFSRLEFQSQGKVAVALGQRGDGVKARHIPILLQYIDKQSRARRVQGSAPPQTIWGFEEPENNLEMSKAVELAKEFDEYSKEIQIFATTHSPAFYSLGTSPGNNIYLVTGSGDEGCTAVRQVKADDLEAVDEHVGMLPMISPSFARAVADRDKFLVMLSEIKKLDSPTIFVEGKTDLMVLKKAFELFAPNLLKAITIKSDTSAGTNWVKDMLISWAYGRVPHKAMGICDSDKAGQESKIDVNNNQRVKSVNSNGTQIKLVLHSPPAALRTIFDKKFTLPVAMEELFPISIWRHAETQDWLEDRTNIVRLNDFNSVSETFVGHCRQQGVSEDELVFLTKCVRNDAKKKFAKYVCGLAQPQQISAFAGFKELVQKTEQFFGPITGSVD